MDNGRDPRILKQFPTNAMSFLTGHLATGLRARAVLALLVAGLGAPAARADAPELLTNERAFAMAARALDSRNLEVRFVVAPGYYLYRDKLRFDVAGNALEGPPTLPVAQMKHDEFFGMSPIYRGEVVIRLHLARPATGPALTVHADSQGCADAGVCYPPQRQAVAVALPSPAARPGPFVEAAPAVRRWFQ